MHHYHSLIDSPDSLGDGGRRVCGETHSAVGGEENQGAHRRGGEGADYIRVH